jgi:hypothetical protein
MLQEDETMKATVAVLAFLAVGAAPAFAQPLEPGRWAGSVSVGADFPIDGDVHGGVDAPIADLGPLNPSLAGVSAELQIESRSFDDIYGEGLDIAVEMARGLPNDREIFAALRYAQSDGSRVQVGGAFVPALSTTLPVFGTFDDYSAIALDAGVRQYFGAGAWRPYVAGRVGVAFVDAINATFEIPDAAITLQDVSFYDESTIFTAGADVGLSYAVTDRVSISGEVGLRYASGLSDEDSDIGGLGLASINDEGDRLSVPVTVRARVAF